MRFFVIFFLFLTFLNANVLQLKFKDFILFVSEKYDINFLYDKDMNINVFMSVHDDISKKQYLDMIKQVLISNNYYLSYSSGFYYIKKIPKKSKIIKINNLDIKKLNSIASKFNLDVHYLNKNNYVVIYDKTDDFNRFYETIKQINFSKTLKFISSIYRVNINNIKNNNININVLIKSINEYSHKSLFFDFFKKIGFDYKNSGDDVSIYLDFLEDKGYINSIVKPNFLCLSGQSVRFTNSKVYRIPNQVVVSYDKTIPTSSTTYEEKTAGLLFKIKPVLVGNMVKIDLSFEDSYYRNKNDNYVKNSIDLDTSFLIPVGQKIAIAGLNSDVFTRNDRKYIPLLSDIPIIKNLFNSSTHSHSQFIYILYLNVSLLHSKTSNSLLKFVSKNNPFKIGGAKK